MFCICIGEFNLYCFATVSLKGVANGKCETSRDGQTSVFLCEPETF